MEEEEGEEGGGVGNHQKGNQNPTANRQESNRKPVAPTSCQQDTSSRRRGEREVEEEEGRPQRWDEAERPERPREAGR